MTEFPISIRNRAPGSAAPPCAAWYLPGTEVSDWLEALGSSGIPDLETLPLHVVPTSREDRTATGLFIPLPTGFRGRRPARCLPFSLSGDRLFMPSEAELRVPLREDEYASLFLQDVVVLFPQLGLIGFESEDAITLSDLLRPPKASLTAWDRAHPAPSRLPEHLHIEAAPPAAADPLSMLRSGGEDIGSKPPDLEKLPPAEDKPRPGPMNQARDAGSRAFFKSVQGFANLFPRDPNLKNPTWVNHLENWAVEKLRELQRRRSDEIDRLLSLLDKDPDKGLKFAIPIGGENDGRGKGEESDSLPERPVDFDLAHLGGGKPVSHWNLDDQRTHRLMESYREAANREMRLCRYRRAAYILGHLLHDYRAAASALKEGGFFREAAVLYEKRLSDSRAAAQCLRDGGLHEEALKLYRELGEFETAGDLEMELGYEQDAIQSWEKAVQEMVRQPGNTLNAARILEQKLSETERARDLLYAAWPWQPEARECLREYFHLNERTEAHELSQQCIGELRERTESQQQSLDLANLFSEIKRDYLHARVSEEAADASRVLVGNVLSAGPTQMDRALVILRSLDESDLLLASDTRRYQKRAKPRVPAPPPRTVEGTTLVCTLKQKLNFRNGFTCLAAIRLRDSMIAIGSRDGRPAIHRRQASGETTLRFRDTRTPPWEKARLILRPATTGGRKDSLAVMSESYFAPLQGGRDEAGHELEVLHWREGLGMALDEFGGAWVLSDVSGALSLEHYDSHWTSTHSIHLSLLPEGVAEEMFHREAPLPMTCSGGKLFFGISDRVVHWDREEGMLWAGLPSPIVDLVSTESWALPRVIVTMESGCAIFWPGRDWKELSEFARNLQRPVAGFLKSGHLVAADAQRIQIYHARQHEIRMLVETEGPGEAPVALIPGSNANGFSLVSPNSIRSYTI